MYSLSGASSNSMSSPATTATTAARGEPAASLPTATKTTKAAKTATDEQKTQRTIKPSVYQKIFLEHWRPAVKSNGTKSDETKKNDRMVQTTLSFTSSAPKSSHGKSDASSSAPTIDSSAPASSGGTIASATNDPAASRNDIKSTQPQLPDAVLRADCHYSYSHNDSKRFIRYTPSPPSVDQSHKPHFEWYCLVALVVVDPVAQFGIDPVCPSTTCPDYLTPSNRSPCPKTAWTWNNNYHPVHTLDRYFFALSRKYECSTCRCRFDALNRYSYSKLPQSVRSIYDIHVVSQSLFINFEFYTFVDIRASETRQFSSLAVDIAELRARHWLIKMRCFLESLLRHKRWQTSQGNKSLFTCDAPDAIPDISLDNLQGCNLPRSVLSESAFRTIFEWIEGPRRNFFDRHMSSLGANALKMDGTEKVTHRILEEQENEKKMEVFAEMQTLLNEHNQVVAYQLAPSKLNDSYIRLLSQYRDRCTRLKLPCPLTITGDRGRIGDLAIVSAVLFANPPAVVNSIKGAIFKSVEDSKQAVPVDSNSVEEHWDRVVRYMQRFRPQYLLDIPHVLRRLTEKVNKSSPIYDMYVKRVSDCFLEYVSLEVPSDGTFRQFSSVLTTSEITKRLLALIDWMKQDPSTPKVISLVDLQDRIGCVREELELKTIGDPIPFALQRADDSTILLRNTQLLESMHSWLNIAFGNSGRGVEAADATLMSLIFYRNVKMGRKNKGDTDFGTIALWELETLNDLGQELFQKLLFPTLPSFPPTPEKFGAQVDFEDVTETLPRVEPGVERVAVAVSIADCMEPRPLRQAAEMLDFVKDPRLLGDSNELSASAVAKPSPEPIDMDMDMDREDSSDGRATLPSFDGVKRVVAPNSLLSTPSTPTTTEPSKRKTRRARPVQDLPDNTINSKIFSVTERTFFLAYLPTIARVTTAAGMLQPDFKAFAAVWDHLHREGAYGVAKKTSNQLLSYYQKLKKNLDQDLLAAEMHRRSVAKEAPRGFPSRENGCLSCRTTHPPGACPATDTERIKQVKHSFFKGLEVVLQGQTRDSSAASWTRDTLYSSVASDASRPDTASTNDTSGPSNDTTRPGTNPINGPAQPSLDEGFNEPVPRVAPAPLPSGDKGSSRQFWTQSEDHCLRELIGKHQSNGQIQWNSVCEEWNSRMDSQAALSAPLTLKPRSVQAMRGRWKTFPRSQPSLKQIATKASALPTATETLPPATSVHSSAGHCNDPSSPAHPPDASSRPERRTCPPSFSSSPAMAMSSPDGSRPSLFWSPVSDDDRRANQLLDEAQSACNPLAADGAERALCSVLGGYGASIRVEPQQLATSLQLSTTPISQPSTPLHCPPSSSQASSSSSSSAYFAHPITISTGPPAPSASDVTISKKRSQPVPADSARQKKQQKKPRVKSATFIWTASALEQFQLSYDRTAANKNPAYFRTHFWKKTITDFAKASTPPTPEEVTEKFRAVRKTVKLDSEEFLHLPPAERAKSTHTKLTERRSRPQSTQGLWLLPSVAHIEHILTTS